MYNPTVGRFTSEDPKGFAPGDVNLFRYVGNGPTNATDPSGMQFGKFNTDQLERDHFLARPLENAAAFEKKKVPPPPNVPVLNPIPQYAGAGKIAPTLLGFPLPGGTSFQFDKAFISNIFTNNPRDPRLMSRGMYVVLTCNHEPPLAKGTQIRFVQIVRDYTIVQGPIFNGATVPLAPKGQDAKVFERAGMDERGAPLPGAVNRLSPGWRVDNPPTSNSPYYGFDVGQLQLVQVGLVDQKGNVREARLFDTPSYPLTNAFRNKGKEFVTVAVKFPADPKEPIEILASVRWGFFVDAKGDVTPKPATPEVRAGAPQEWYDSVERWNKLPSVIKVNLP